MKRLVCFCKWFIFKAIVVFVVDKRFALGVMAFLLLWMPAVSQTDAVPVDTIVVTDFDRIDPVYVSASMDAAKRREYLILKRRVIKTMPYAKMAAMKMKAMEDKLQTIQGRRERSKYVKQCEESIKKMYMDQLKNLTIGEGQVLMKLLHRETGKTSWEIMRNYRGTGEAIFWQAFGSIYGHSLLTEYDPVLDYQIENIIKLERLE
ncbi:MAG: DUF4294 domain-containing protein [Flavobacteriaceae bacterium]|nr:DUF4294 domain-containing protein [Flavobacteriaceae bacterium]PHX76478.1 MAG: hypothetical protein CK543_06045 [Flavobacteriales bacterium]